MNPGGPASGAGLERKRVEKAVDSSVRWRALSGATASPRPSPSPWLAGKKLFFHLRSPPRGLGLLGPQRCPRPPGGACGWGGKHVSVCVGGEAGDGGGCPALCALWSTG